MKKYNKPIITIDNIEVKEVIAALSNANNGIDGVTNLNGNDTMSWSEFWN